MKTRPIEPDEKIVPGMLLLYKGMLGVPQRLIVAMSVPFIPALYKNLKYLKVLDSYDGKIQHWQITYFDGSDYSRREDLEIVVLEDEEGE